MKVLNSTKPNPKQKATLITSFNGYTLCFEGFQTLTTLTYTNINFIAGKAKAELSNLEI